MASIYWEESRCGASFKPRNGRRSKIRLLRGEQFARKLSGKRPLEFSEYQRLQEEATAADSGRHSGNCEFVIWPLRG